MNKTSVKWLSMALSVIVIPLAATAQEPGGPPRRGGPPPPARGSLDMFASPLLAHSPREKEVLAVLDDMDRNQRRGSLSVPREDGRILRLFAEATGAKNVVEIGTSIGYSSIWFALALERTGGKLTTFEIDPGRAATARQNFKRAGVDKIITVVEGDAHEEVKKLKDPIDILFLDADKQGYVDYLNKLLPLVRPGGLVIAHNMSRAQADPRYLEAITTNPELETLFLNLQTSGIGVTMKKR
ncbi:MAG TPA: O-methyltransferase [Verrucomicrobiota bacterium]|jgi:caffeoyl-CoA O-methyltransferase|nr:O-methyltransferase [Verrucomicrobiota bacterium]HRT07096.1 O-methyltransferase [Candidatus Paceibacterota bacterium]HRT58352.1 O-methyltransferase [Candidatus Paceibacterota bacterium]